MTRNANITYEITTSDGRCWHETARNSFGSFVNLMHRIETRLGGTANAVDAEASVWQVGDVRFTLTEVQKALKAA